MGDDCMAYDNGYMKGCFDKWNNIPERNWSDVELNQSNVDYVAGYIDGYNTSEARI